MFFMRHGTRRFIFTAVVIYRGGLFCGRALYTQDNKAKKRLLLVVSLIGNLGMLCS